MDLGADAQLVTGLSRCLLDPARLSTASDSGLPSLGSESPACRHYPAEDRHKHRRLAIPNSHAHFTHSAGGPAIGLFPLGEMHLRVDDLAAWSRDGDVDDDRSEIIARTIEFMPPPAFRAADSPWVNQSVRFPRIPLLCEAYAMLCFEHRGTSDMGYWLTMLAYIWKYIDKEGSEGLAEQLAEGEVRGMYLSIDTGLHDAAARAGRKRFLGPETHEG